VALKKIIKRLAIIIMEYALLISVIIGVRAMHDMDLQLGYYMVMTCIVIPIVIVVVFIKPEHIEKLFKKDSTISMIFVLALRFLPLINRRITNIKHNQQMRGAKYGIISQFKNYLSLFIPAVVSSISWAQRLGDGLRIRGGE
jgi:energy-coupling factor transporter transmembrane protein EcfT